MRRFQARTVTVLAATLAIAVPVAADRVVISLKLSIETFATRPAEGRPPRVLFAKEPAFAEVSLAVAALPSPGENTGTQNLPRSDWARNLAWDFRRLPGGESVDIGVEPLSIHPREASDAPGSHLLGPGTRQRVRYRLSGLEPGVYEIRVRVAGLESNRERFLVSTGDETSDLRREYARYKVFYRSPDLESLEKHLRELAPLDPLDAGPWIRLADVAVGKRSLDETLRRYADASAALARRREHFVKLGKSSEVEEIAKHERVLDHVQNVLPRVYAPNSDLTLVVHQGVFKRYLVIDRKTGKRVAQIDAISTGVE